MRLFQRIKQFFSPYYVKRVSGHLLVYCDGRYVGAVDDKIIIYSGDEANAMPITNSFVNPFVAKPNKMTEDEAFKHFYHEMLDDAIRHENYKEAARLRDKYNDLRQGK